MEIAIASLVIFGLAVLDVLGVLTIVTWVREIRLDNQRRK